MTTINPGVTRGPVDVYTAPVGTAFTGILGIGSLDPAWKKLGSRGWRSQDTGGVTITHRQKVEEWRGENTVIMDAARSEQDIMVAFSLADVTMEALTAAMNGNAVVATAAATGTKGKKKMVLDRGFEIVPVALLLVFKSPYITGEKGIMYLPKCFQNADSDIAINKSNPALTKFEFKVLEGPNATDTDADIGYYEIITAAALP